MRGKVLLACAGAASLFFWAHAAQANPAMRANEMQRALPLANTPFKQCVLQSKMQSAQSIVLSDEAITVGRSAASVGERAFAEQFSGGRSARAPQQPWLPAQGAQQAHAPGLTFSQGLGYTSLAQSWLQLFNGGDARRAAVMMAHGEASQLIIGRRFRSDPARLSDDQLARDVGILGLLERGLVSLSVGDIECAVNFYDFAIERSDLQQGSFWGSAIEGYEHIIALDLKATAYLLAGDRRARNMIQQSRELQSRARDEYAQQLAQKSQQARQQSASEGMPEQDAWMNQFGSAFSSSALNGNTRIASRMATPYVNPLPDYLSAVIAESEAQAGTGTRDEWSRAAVAWRNAATLAPGVPFLAAAAQRRPPAGMKTVHVLVGVGAAPARAVASMYFSYENQPFPVKMPVMAPQRSRVRGESGVVRVGAVSAPLQLVSDVEAMAIRQAEDERPAEMLAALVRGWIAFKAGQAAGSNSDNPLMRALGGAVRDALAEPPTNAWLSLPAGYYAARLVVPQSASEATVQIPGAGSQTYALRPNAATFVYVTAKDNQLWGLAQAAEFGADELQFQAQ